MSRYGYIPDLGDKRDHTFQLPARISLPPSVDLRSGCPQVYDQGDLGSCTANAIAAAIEFDRLKQKLPDIMPSRLFIYYNERVIEHTVQSDAGAMIRDGIKSVNLKGICPEPEWPYDISQFKVKPSAKCYADALKDKVLAYQRVTQNILQMKAVLATGFPFVVGFTVYETFESKDVADTGIVPMPGRNEGVLGGHAVLCCGYSDTDQRFLFRNSWGTGWGMQGYFTMPYQYLQDPKLSSDFWMIKTVQ